MQLASLLRACSVITPVALGSGSMTAQASAWVNLNVNGPSPREWSSMAFDAARGRTVLFGGQQGSALYGDTWEWDGLAWTQVSTTGPLPRASHVMAFDSLRGRVLLHSGQTSSGPSSETWSFDGNAWTLLGTGGPTVINGAMVYDDHRDRMVLCSQYINACGTGGGRSTWEWGGTSWQYMSTSSAGVGYSSSMSYDNRRGRTVLDGGCNGLVEWDGATWTAAGGGTGVRAWSAMAFDSLRGMAIVFGGYTTGAWYADTYSWTGTNWGYWGTSGPSARCRHSMAFDAARGNVVLFGGNGNGAILGDTWVFEPVPAAASSTFGSGCGSPPLNLATLASPIIGRVATAAISGAPSAQAFIALGWSRTHAGPFALPMPLAGYGMSGCYLWQSADLTGGTIPTGPGTAAYDLPLPNWMGIAGLNLFLQAWAFAPGANAGNTIVSSGLDWFIGY